MGFLKGSQIRPELGRADFSPIERGGAAMGNAWASIGQSIGQAIQEKKAKDAEKAKMDEFVSWGVGQGWGTEEDLRHGAKAVGVENAANWAMNKQATDTKNLEEVKNTLLTIDAWRATPKKEDGTRDQVELYKNAVELGVTNLDLLDTMWDNEKSSTGVTVNVGGEETIAAKEATSRSEGRIAWNNAIMNDGLDAEIMEGEAGRAIALIEDEGARTGFGQGLEVLAKQALSAFGVETDVANMEELNQLLGDQVMARVSETKGSVSEREMKLFQDYSASPLKTPEGNLAIMKAVRRQAARAKEMARIVDEGRYNDKSSKDIQREVIAYRDANPLFSEDILESNKPYSVFSRSLSPLAPANGEPNVAPPTVPVVDADAEVTFNKLFGSKPVQ